MMKLKVYWVACILVFAVTFTNCTKVQEDNEKTPCEQLDEIDLKMLRILDQINEEYKYDKKFLAAMKDAQIYWTQYRNRHVKAIFPLPPAKYDYNVGECKCEIYRDLTALRVKELEKWIEGILRNEACKGSYKVK